jgi:hypothetical protein
VRRRINVVVDGIEECRQPNGYIMAYPEETIFYSERAAYTRAWLTHGDGADTHYTAGADPALFVAPADYTVKDRPDMLHPPAGTNVGTGVGNASVSEAEAGRVAEARKSPHPGIKSEVAYKPAMAKTDLPDAQTLAEEAVKLEEERTVVLDLKQVDAGAFAKMAMLSRYWNTLGWVFFRQGKLAQAERYTRAAWDLDLQGY